MKRMWFHHLAFIFVLTETTIGDPLKVLSTSFIKHANLIGNLENYTSQAETIPTKCTKQILDIHDISFLKNGDIYVRSYNATTHPSSLMITINGLHVCFLPTKELKKEIFKTCEKWLYDQNEYKKFPNGSVMLYDELLQEGTYDFNEDGKLVMCSVDYDETYDDNDDPGVMPRTITNVDKASTYIGKIGSSISILALLAHIITFCFVPSLRNLPGKNLVSLSVAFLLAYSFVVIGQIPEVLGTFCVVSAILQQYFFLAAFFWMNVMAFDVWKTLKMATEKLRVSTRTARRLQFLWSSLYAWLIPLCISTVSVVIDESRGVNDKIKPQFGRGDICWITNNIAKAIFFLLPAFTVFFINLVFFVLSAFILKQNTMKHMNESEQKKTAQLNFFLYIRLAMMMGITWLVGVIAILSGSTVVWLIFDVLNSLQGLFVFLLFTCSRKVFRHIQVKMFASSRTSFSDKSTSTYSTKCETTRAK